MTKRMYKMTVAAVAAVSLLGGISAFAAENVIGSEAAQTAALDAAKLKAEDVTYIKDELDHDDGRTYYEVEFFDGTLKYDYDIEASTGEILKYSREIENYREEASSETITLEDAKEAALEDAELTGEEVTWVKEKEDRDDGISYYDLSFVYDSGLYEYEISTATGEVVSMDWEAGYSQASSKGTSKSSTEAGTEASTN